MKKNKKLIILLIVLITTLFTSCDLFMMMFNQDPSELYFWSLVDEYDKLNPIEKGTNSIEKTPLEYTLYDDSKIIITRGENDETENDPPGYSTSNAAQSRINHITFSLKCKKKTSSTFEAMQGGEKKVEEHPGGQNWHVAKSFNLKNIEKGIIYEFKGSSIETDGDSFERTISIKFK